MAQTDSRAVVTEMFARLNAHDPAGLRGLFSMDDEEWAPWDRSLRAMFRAFPDYRADVERMVVEGDSVAVQYRVNGTHAAEYPAAELAGIPATGRTLHWAEAQFFVVRDGLIEDGDMVVSGVERLQQLGVLPETASTFPAE